MESNSAMRFDSPSSPQCANMLKFAEFDDDIHLHGGTDGVAQPYLAGHIVVALGLK